MIATSDHDPRPTGFVSFLGPVADLATDVASGRIVVGYNWTAVEALFPDGAVLGLAASPSKSDGACTTPETGSFGGRPLAELGRMALSTNTYERAIGLAACNAFWAACTNLGNLGDLGDLGDADDQADGLTANPGEKVVVIGRFPGLDRKLPGALVLERNPGPDDIPSEKAPEIVPTADRLIITATTLINGSIDGLVSLVRPGCAITLVGPGTPLCPGLFALGVDRLAGFVVTDTNACFKAVMEGAGARAFKKHGRPILLKHKA